MKPTANLSIICANYNNGRYLDDFIRSVGDSTMHPAELIVIDDGSTDNSLEVLESYRHLPFLRIMAFPENRGFTAALNAGLEAATAKYIMRADPDDLMMPERIETQFAYLESHPEVDLLGSNAIYFDSESGRELNTTHFPANNLQIHRLYRRGEHGLLHATVAGKRIVYHQYRYQPLTPGEDYELFARMANDGVRMANLPQPLYKVRVHTQSASNQLQLQAIQRTFHFRDQIYGTHTSSAKIKRYYHHITAYRKFLICKNPFKKLIYLLLAVVLHPPAFFRRLFPYCEP